MPTYGYHCDSCGTEFDVWQSMSDEPGAECPKCAGKAHRLFYPAGIVFKGSGFYKTDSRSSSGGGSSATKESSGSVSSDSGSSSASGGTSDSSVGKSSSGDSGAGKSKPSDSGSGSSATSGE